MVYICVCAKPITLYTKNVNTIRFTLFWLITNVFFIGNVIAIRFLPVFLLPIICIVGEKCEVADTN